MQSIDNKELKINLDVLLVGLNIHKQNPTQYTLKKILVCLCKSMISAKNEEDFEYIKSFLEESRKYEYVSDKCLNLLINFSQPNNLNQAKELLIYRENEKRKEKELLSKRENEKSKVKAFIKEYDEINKEFDILDDRLHQLDDFKNLCRRLVNLEDSLDEFELNLDEAKRYEGILEDKLHFLLQIINKIEHVLQDYSALTNYAESFCDENELDTFQRIIYCLETELDEIKDYMALGFYNRIINDIEEYKKQINNFSNTSYGV